MKSAAWSLPVRRCGGCCDACPVVELTDDGGGSGGQVFVFREVDDIAPGDTMNWNDVSCMYAETNGSPAVQSRTARLSSWRT